MTVEQTNLNYIGWLEEWMQHYIKPTVKMRTYERYRHGKRDTGCMQVRSRRERRHDIGRAENSRITPRNTIAQTVAADSEKHKEKERFSLRSIVERKSHIRSLLPAKF